MLRDVVPLVDWNVSSDQARELQHSLAGEVVCEGKPDVEVVAGLSLSMDPEGRIGIGGAVAVDFETGEVLDRSALIGDITFPYEPGLLAFREGPLLMDLALGIRPEPDLLILRGHGIAHPRSFGLASHIGLQSGIPTLGCADSILVGEADVPGNQRGDYSDFRHEGLAGYCIRTMEKAKPIFCSVGNGFEPEAILDWIPLLTNGEERFPFPLGEASRLAGSIWNRLTMLRDGVDESIEVYLVGGALRQLLTGEIPRDYDVVIQQLSENTRNRLAENWGGHWFELDGERGHFRLTGPPELDVKQLSQTRLEEDLGRRDFTVNSIGLGLKKESWIDPFGGRSDAEQKLLRPTRTDSIVQDPIRILRAIRFQVKHGFNPTEGLRQRMVSRLEDLKQVARERILEEIFRLLETSDFETVRDHLDQYGVFELKLFQNPDSKLVRGLEKFIPVVRDQIDWKESFHGEYSLLICLLAGLLISEESRSGWPMNQTVKRRLRSIERGYRDAPCPDLLASAEKWFGWQLGSGIRDGNTAEEVQDRLSRVGKFLELRSRKEKRVVDELLNRGVDEVGEKKVRILEDELPGLRDEILTG